MPHHERSSRTYHTKEDAAAGGTVTARPEKRLGLRSRARTSQRPKASPERNGDKEARPKVCRIAPGAGKNICAKNSRKVKSKNPDHKHETEAGGARTHEDVECETDAGGNEGGAEEGNPEGVPGNPAGNQTADEGDAEKVVDSENDESQREDVTGEAIEEAGDCVAARQQPGDACDGKRLEDESAKAHVGGDRDVARNVDDECAEKQKRAERESAGSRSGTEKKAECEDDDDRAEEIIEPRKRRKPGKHRCDFELRDVVWRVKIDEAAGADDGFDAHAGDGERVDGATGAENSGERF